MQINDIINLDSKGTRDVNSAIGNDFSNSNGPKIITDNSIKYKDFAKFEKEEPGVVDMSNLTYNHHNNNSLIDELEKGLDYNGNFNAVSAIAQHNFNALEELGFDAKDMDEKEFVDIADKIRIAMAKGGADISMMGDVSDAAIKASGSYTQAVESALKDAQLPTDERNVQDSVTALREVDEIKNKMTVDVSKDVAGSVAGSSLPDEAVKYMLSNELEPTIDNIYKATTKSNDNSYASPIDLSGNTDSLESQFMDIIKEAGLDVNESSLKDCYWMVENRISVTKEQLVRLDELRSLSLDDVNNALDSIIDAIREGRSAKDAYLAPGYSVMGKANALNMGIALATNETIDEMVADNETLTIGNVAEYALERKNGIETDRALRELYADKTLSYVQEFANEMSQTIKEGTDVSNPDAISAKRQLAEIQLMMSTEANYSLLKRGFAVDTLKLNEYVDALEELERQFLDTMLGDKASPEAVKNLSDSMDAVTMAKSLPDYAMPLDAMSMTLRSYASISVTYSEINYSKTASQDVIASQNTNEAKTLQANFSLRYEQARDYYELSATEVRRDLGDSLSKAFRNVDSLLSEMKLDLTEENRRAVRILGYNEAEITEQSIKEVKATDLMVTRALDSLKPGVVAQMIKTGYNPLDMTMEELESTAEEIMSNTQISDEEEKFSEFLWRLEQENGITEDEREGFIGVFRLIHQVNESDGAAIGMLLQQGRDVTMRNLLTATRTARHENREYTVDDNFGGIKGFNKDSLNIEQQIEMSIQSVSMRNAEDEITPYKLMQFDTEEGYMSLTPEQLSDRLSQLDGDESISAHEQELTDAYSSMRRDEVLRSFGSGREVIDYLEANNIPLTSNNINAITQLLSDRNSMYSTLFNKAANRRIGLEKRGSYASEVGMDKADDSDSLEDEIQDIIANLIHEYGESVKTPEDMAKAERRLEEMAENVMKNMLVEEDVRTIDVRGMHLIQTQIKTLGKISEQAENYNIPIMVADEVGNLSLKIVRGTEEKGLIDIAFDMDKTGPVTASFRYEAGEFVGEVNCDRESTRHMLEARQKTLESAVSHETDSNIKIRYSWNKRIDVNSFALTGTQPDFTTATREEALDNSNETQNVLTKNLYGMARAFIEELGNV